MTAFQPAGQGTPPPRGPTVIRPGAYWYIIAAVLAVAGIVVGSLLAIAGLTGVEDQAEDDPRISVPGEASIEITSTGEYTLYYAFPGAESNTSFVPPTVTVAAPDGTDVPTSLLGRSEGFPGDTPAVSFATFDAAAVGTFTFVVADDGGSGNEVIVGQSFRDEVISTVLLSMGLVVGTVVGAIVIVVVVAVKRGKAKRAASEDELGWPPYQPAPGTMAQSPPPQAAPPGRGGGGPSRWPPAPPPARPGA